MPDIVAGLSIGKGENLNCLRPPLLLFEMPNWQLKTGGFFSCELEHEATGKSRARNA